MSRPKSVVVKIPKGIHRASAEYTHALAYVDDLLVSAFKAGSLSVSVPFTVMSCVRGRVDELEREVATLRGMLGA